MFEIEDKGMREFSQSLTYLEKNFPKESKKLMNRVGVRVRSIVRKKAKGLVGKKTGNYYKSIKKGRAFISGSKEFTVRVFPAFKVAPHAHLIERGHRIVGKDGSEHGFQEGKFIFDKSGTEIEAQYTKIVEEEFDKILKKM